MAVFPSVVVRIIFRVSVEDNGTAEANGEDGEILGGVRMALIAAMRVNTSP